MYIQKQIHRYAYVYIYIYNKFKYNWQTARSPSKIETADWPFQRSPRSHSRSQRPRRRWGRVALELLTLEPDIAPN